MTKGTFKRAMRPAALLAALALCAALSAACDAVDEPGEIEDSPEQPPVVLATATSIDDAALRDNAATYAYEDEDSVVTMYLTVRRGNKADGTDHTWEEINRYSVYDYENLGVARYAAEGILQVGDENGPVEGELGYGVKIPNAVVSMRGASSSRAQQKSYKIELNKGAGEWRAQQTIALNKHIFDALRLRNKLSFDLMRNIPDLISLRTQFVHLYVKDETKEAPDEAFVDYGLYTQVEQPNKRFLKNHGLDSNGQMYKATFFEFERYDDILKLKSDPGYDAAKFEQYLEIKGSDDHAKLLEMLDALNDTSQPIEDVFERCFDSENYFTFLAFNILIGNIDTETQNFFLYSPLNSSKWYFINWDCDSVLNRKARELEAGQQDFGYESGVSNYWGTVLHNRVLRIPRYRKMLDDKINELRKILTAERIDSMARRYFAVTEPYLFRMPDLLNAPETHEIALQTLGSLKDEAAVNYNLYLESLQKPMPFYIFDPVIKDGKTLFEWSSSFDFAAQDVTYTFELGTDYLFTQPLTRAEGLRFTTYETGQLPPGQYFVRLTATNKSGKTQGAMANYESHGGKRYYGTQCFYVLEDGTVELRYGE